MTLTYEFTDADKRSAGRLCAFLGPIDHWEYSVFPPTGGWFAEGPTLWVSRGPEGPAVSCWSFPDRHSLRWVTKIVDERGDESWLSTGRTPSEAIEAAIASLDEERRSRWKSTSDDDQTAP